MYLMSCQAFAQSCAWISTSHSPMRPWTLLPAASPCCPNPFDSSSSIPCLTGKKALARWSSLLGVRKPTCPDICRPSRKPMCWREGRKGFRCFTRLPTHQSSSYANWSAAVWKSSLRSRPAPSPGASVVDGGGFTESAGLSAPKTLQFIALGCTSLPFRKPKGPILGV